ncbi:MAG: DUF3276 family protein [Gammaproteobacteria bacterium]|nr:DUF3276 family protein [Gammaproteobacteria bacterium]NNC96968.1 DUF3276 family protein [Gammaproteobacteria bacterium]NNM13413.1 DUF3276 family protein [Gammaproteobacteria bacterium]
MNQDIFHTQVTSKSRNYFFDIKQSQRGDYYLVINQSKKSQDGYERQSLLLFNNVLPDFALAFTKSLEKLTQLDPSLNLQESGSESQPAIQESNGEPKKRFRQLSPEEIAHEQMVNERSGRPKNSGLRWSSEDRTRVKKFFLRGEAIKDIADTLGRSVHSITAELKKQGLIVTEENYTNQKNPF